MISRYHLRNNKLRFVEKLRHERVLTWGRRVLAVGIANLGLNAPSWQYSCIKITPKGRLQQMESALFFFERLEFYRTPIINDI